MESYNNAKWEFRISESITRTEMQKGALMESFGVLAIRLRAYICPRNLHQFIREERRRYQEKR